MRAAPERVLATVLTVIADAGAADARAPAPGVRSAKWPGIAGRSVDKPASALVATFDGPGRAVQCGCSVAAVAQRSRIAVRAGVHIGECDPSSSSTARSWTSAPTSPPPRKPGEVLVSRTVVDLVPGSGLQFADRGSLAVTGDSREVAVLAARRG